MVSKLIEALEDDEIGVRISAALLLGEIGEPEAECPLLEVLESNVPLSGPWSGRLCGRLKPASLRPEKSKTNFYVASILTKEVQYGVRY